MSQCKQYRLEGAALAAVEKIAELHEQAHAKQVTAQKLFQETMKDLKRDYDAAVKPLYDQIHAALGLTEQQAKNLELDVNYLRETGCAFAIVHADHEGGDAGELGNALSALLGGRQVH